jgi:hypothetical protein
MLIKKEDDGELAQLVEQWTFNPFVAGSTPALPTKILQAVVFLFSSD